MGKVLFLTREIQATVLFFFLLYRQIYCSQFFVVFFFLLIVCINNREKAGNDVINILTDEDMENVPLESRM